MAFDEEFTALFQAHHHRLARYLGRLSGERAVAEDLAQEAFVRLYRRGAVPERPAAWLITVALNLLRSRAASRSRRQRLLTPWRMLQASADPPPAPGDGATGDEVGRVRRALATLRERDRQLLLLQAEGYGYREMAEILALEPGSVGTLLARARRAFRSAYGEPSDAP